MAGSAGLGEPDGVEGCQPDPAGPAFGVLVWDDGAGIILA